MSAPVTVEYDTGIAEIVFDAPTDQNLLNEATSEAFRDAVSEVEAADVEAAVLRGAGDVFCGGGDLRQSPEAFVRGVDVSIDAVIDIYTSDIPYVAAVRGAAIGGGFEIALACDFRVVGREATLALPEVTLGLVPPAGAVRFLAHVAGRATAIELCLTGRRLSGSEAVERGLVTEATDDAAVDARARELAGDLTDNSAPAVAAIKRSVNAAFPRPIDNGKWDLALARSLARGDDFAEGKRAFLENRRPKF